MEKDLIFAGFLVFHCPLKPDAIAAIRMLNDSSHRVRDIAATYLSAADRFNILM